MKINKDEIGGGPGNVQDLKQSISILLSVTEHEQQALKGLLKKKRELKDELKRLKGMKKQGISNQKRKKARGDEN